jgi:hypothetical protein
MTFRPYLLLTLLAFAAHGTGQAPSGAAPIQPPWFPPTTGRAATGREYPTAPEVDKQQVLFAKHDSDNYVGLVILLPDWQRSGQLWQLTRELGRLGFDTLLLLLAAADRAGPRRREETAGHRRFSQAVCLPHQQAGGCQAAGGGFKLLLAQYQRRLGRQPHRQRAVARPDALVLLDGFFPSQLSNQTLAKQIAQASIPTLDLYQEEGGRWPLLAAEAAEASRRSHKLNYRPYALMDLDETPGRIQGWLTHLGWI